MIPPAPLRRIYTITWFSRTVYKEITHVTHQPPILTPERN